MKIIVEESPTSPLPFPKLMIDKSDGEIVLVHHIVGGDAIGTIINPGRAQTNEDSGLGVTRRAVELTDFLGTITLSN